MYKIIYPKGCLESAAYLASTGCGTGWNDKLVPDNLIGLDISECCKIHDYMYTVGRTSKDRNKADRLFYKNMKAIVMNDSDLILRATRLAMAWAYYIAVVEFGKSSFWEGKVKKKSLLEKLAFWKRF